MQKNRNFSDNSTVSDSPDNLSPRAHWNSLDAKGKWQYIKDYYLLKIVITVLLVGFIGYLSYVTCRPKDQSQLYCMVLNDTLDQEGSKQLLNSFSQSIGRSGKGYSYTLDDNTNLTRKNSEYTAQQKISTYAYAKKLDLIIAEEDTLKYIAENGYLVDITQVLPSDLYGSTTDKLVYTKQENEDTEHAYGISIADSDLYNQISYNHIQKSGRKMAIGIVGNTQNRDNSVQFIQYLLNNK